MSLATGEDAILWLVAKRKNPAAVALGKRRAALAEPGEMKALSEANAASGGHARAAGLSKKRRSEIAKKAAAARWGKKK